MSLIIIILQTSFLLFLKKKKWLIFFCYFISYFFKRNFIRACLSFFSKVKTFTIQRGSQMQLKKWVETMTGSRNKYWKKWDKCMNAIFFIFDILDFFIWAFGKRCMSALRTYVHIHGMHNFCWMNDDMKMHIFIFDWIRMHA